MAPPRSSGIIANKFSPFIAAVMFHHGEVKPIKLPHKIFSSSYFKGTIALLIIIAFAIQWISNSASERNKLNNFKLLLKEGKVLVKHHSVNSLFAISDHDVSTELSKAETLCLLNLSPLGMRKPPPTQQSLNGYTTIEIGTELLFLETIQKEDVLFILPWVKKGNKFKGYGFAAMGNCPVEFGENET